MKFEIKAESARQTSGVLLSIKIRGKLEEERGGEEKRYSIQRAEKLN